MLGSRASAAPRPAFEFSFLFHGGTRPEPVRSPAPRPHPRTAFRDHPRGAAPLAEDFLALRIARCGSVLTTMRRNTLPDESPQKTLAGSHFYTALILINGLVVIGLHNGGPFGTARRQSMQREGASGGSSTDPTGTGSAGNCHWGAAAAQVPTGSGRRLRLRGWGRNRPPLSEWGSSITTSSHFPLNAGKSL